jgi:hypothetical protein
VEEMGEGGTVTERMEQGLADGCVGVGEGVKRFGCVDDPTALCRQPLQPETFPVPDEHGWRVTVYF